MTLQSLATSPTASGLYWRYLLDAFARLGIDMSGFASAGDEGMPDPGLRIELDEVDRVFAHAHAAWAGDVPLSLQLGASVTPGALDVLAYASMSSNNLGEAIALLCDFETYRLGFAACHVERSEDVVMVVMRTQGSWPSLPAQVEASLAGWITFGRWITGRMGHHAKQVSFTHACPSDPLDYERFFGCPVMFNQAVNAVHLLPEQTAWPLAAPNPDVSRLMRDEMQRRVERFAKGDQFQARLEGAIEDMLPLGELTLEAVANQLDLTERQLRARCTQAGCTFASVLDGVRQRLARQHLDAGKPLMVISERLGYSEQSAFTRACQRWFGVRPSQWPGRST